MISRPYLLKAALSLTVALAAIASATGGGDQKKPAADKPALDESTKLRVLLVMDTDDPSIGESVSVDVKTVESLLREGFEKHPEMLEITKLEGKKNFTTKAVLEYLASVKLGPSETLMVYFCCHGATDPNKGHSLVMYDAAGKQVLVPRSTLRNLMLSKHPRLAVLLTDSCANKLETEDIRAVAKPDWKVMHSLFLKPKGLVDINSVSEGETANGDGKRGGIFTRWFAYLCRSEFSKLNPSSDDQLFWHDLIPQVQASAQGTYNLARKIQIVLYQQALNTKQGQERAQIEADVKLLEKQSHQTIQVFHLPSQFRFGARLLENDGFGVRVAFIHAGTPAAAAGLKPGDVLLKVGSNDVKSLDQFFQAVMRANGEIGVEFQRAKTRDTTKIRLPKDVGVSQDI